MSAQHSIFDDLGVPEEKIGIWRYLDLIDDLEPFFIWIDNISNMSSNDKRELFINIYGMNNEDKIDYQKFGNFSCEDLLKILKSTDE